MTHDSVAFIDGDFDTDTPCPFHCSPTCHPAQIGPDWKYACRHPDWELNRIGDFPPIVRCGGQFDKCELPGGYTPPSDGPGR